jgi:formylglycine-generating enzyme required for sulfatase activity
VSYYEADAFARWSGARLPTEAEWETIAGAPAGTTRTQLFGEAWQWTSSDYAPYPGFAPAAGAVGEYNGKFMVSQHTLRGSSRLTPPGHERLTYRNFFPPSARWAMTGVRLAR